MFTDIKTTFRELVFVPHLFDTVKPYYLFSDKLIFYIIGHSYVQNDHTFLNLVSSSIEVNKTIDFSTNILISFIDNNDFNGHKNLHYNNNNLFSLLFCFLFSAYHI